MPIIESRPPPSFKGKFVKIKFCTQFPKPYPQFAFFCNHPKYVKEPYKRFLENKKIAPEFPAEPPPKMVNGYHPEYGKKANRYKKLDPASANAMPETGDPETDAIVKKQKTINKIKSMKKK